MSKKPDQTDPLTTEPNGRQGDGRFGSGNTPPAMEPNEHDIFDAAGRCLACGAEAMDIIVRFVGGGV